MEVIVTYRHIDSSPGLQSHIEGKIYKLRKFLNKPIKAHVIFNVENSRHVAEIALSEGPNSFYAKDDGRDMYHSLDRVIAKMLHQLQKHKEKIKNHHWKSNKA